MKRVRLPERVAFAIDSLRERGFDNQEILKGCLSGFDSDLEENDLLLNYCKKNFDKVGQALYIGYDAVRESVSTDAFRVYKNGKDLDRYSLYIKEIDITLNVYRDKQTKSYEKIDTYVNEMTYGYSDSVE